MLENRDEMKVNLLNRALVHVPFDGWSQEVLERAAQEVCGDSSYGWRLFPKGALEAIAYWSERLDQEMLHTLPAPDDIRVREKVALAVKARLQLLAPHREAAQKTVKYLTFPAYVGLATRLLYQTVNEIWYYAGDVSTDYNFYTKRALLAWVYSSTFLYWLRDDSDDFEKTWDFLERRIQEVLNLPHIPLKIISTFFSGKSHG